MSAWRGSLTLALITGSLLSQGVRATLVGRITDGSGAVIPNAKIKLANPASGDERNAQSSGTGDFVLPQLTLGEYVLTVEHAGFNTEVRRGIVLETGQEARVDITPEGGGANPGDKRQRAAAPLVSSENATGRQCCRSAENRRTSPKRP